MAAAHADAKTSPSRRAFVAPAAAQAASSPGRAAAHLANHPGAGNQGKEPATRAMCLGVGLRQSGVSRSPPRMRPRVLPFHLHAGGEFASGVPNSHATVATAFVSHALAVRDLPPQRGNRPADGGHADAAGATRRAASTLECSETRPWSGGHAPSGYMAATVFATPARVSAKRRCGLPGPAF